MKNLVSTFMALSFAFAGAAQARTYSGDWRKNTALSKKEKSILVMADGGNFSTKGLTNETVMKFVGVYRDDMTSLDSSSDVTVSVEGDHLVARITRVGAKVTQKTLLLDALNDVLGRLPLDTRLSELSKDDMPSETPTKNIVVVTPAVMTWYDINYSFFRLEMSGENDALILRGNELRQLGSQWGYPGRDGRPMPDDGGNIVYGTKIK